MRSVLHVIVMLAATLPYRPVAEAQTAATPPCAAPAYTQFDFWVGSWNVTNQGKLAGRNRIEKILGGCALLETWQSTGQYRGRSLTFYDAGRGVWHQTWIDVNGQPLYLEGRFTEGRMRLEGTRPGDKEGTLVQHRIDWTTLPGGRVRQHWRTSSDGGRTWSAAFDGYYEKTG